MYKDLSVPINEQTPVYPGDPEVQVKPAGVLDQHGYQDHFVSIGTHAGTHMDAPAHMIEGGKTLDQYPVSRFFGRGVVINAENGFDLKNVQNSDIREGDIVLFYTGFDTKYDDPAYFELYPELPIDIARYLVEQKVSIVGVDMCSPDHKPFLTHKVLLGGDVLIVENLRGLGELKGDITISALPIKLELDAAPCRVIAKVSL